MGAEQQRERREGEVDSGIILDGVKNLNRKRMTRTEAGVQSQERNIVSKERITNTTVGFLTDTRVLLPRVNLKNLPCSKTTPHIGRQQSFILCLTFTPCLAPSTYPG